MTRSQQRRLSDQPEGAATLINEGCKVAGLITGTGDFLINGEIDGDCDLTGTVTLARNGLWTGTIKADNVIISGHVEGDIVAAGRVEITETANISGTISGAAIAVAEGAVVEGVMRTTEQSDPTEFIEKRADDDKKRSQ